MFQERERKTKNISSVRPIEYVPTLPKGLREPYPALSSLTYLTIPAETNAILNDLDPFLRNKGDGSVVSELLELLAGTMTRDVVLVSAWDLTESLLRNTRDLLAVSSDEATAILLPGEGARSVELFIREKNPAILSGKNIYRFPARRVLRENRVFDIDLDIPEDLIKRVRAGELSNISVIDDVIDTGETLRRVREQILLKAGTFDDMDYNPSLRFSFPKLRVPMLRFQASSWLCLDPRKKPRQYRDNAASSILGYDSIITTATYAAGGSQAIVPMNSLSTFIRGDERAQAVLEGYQKYVHNRKEFFEIVDLLKELVEITI